jgi:hypothetical protein
MLEPDRSVSTVQRRYEDHRATERVRFDRAHERWHGDVTRWDAAAVARRDAPG